MKSMIALGGVGGNVEVGAKTEIQRRMRNVSTDSVKVPVCLTCHVYCT